MRAAAAANALAGRSLVTLPAVSAQDKTNAIKGDPQFTDDDNSDNDSVTSSSFDGGSDAGSTSSSRLTDNGDYNVDIAPPLDPNRKISPLHKDILTALTNSTYLSPVNVDVLNESYWYRSRARLGPKKQNATIVKLNPKSNFFEAYMYKMKVWYLLST